MSHENEVEKTQYDPYQSMPIVMVRILITMQLLFSFVLHYNTRLFTPYCDAMLKWRSAFNRVPSANCR